jgi:hypothetical protein
MSRPTLLAVTKVHCSLAAMELGEKNDCAVRTVAIAAQIDYKRAHALLASLGRKSRKGTMLTITRAAFEALGCKLVEEQFAQRKRTTGQGRWYPVGLGLRSRSVKTLPKELPQGTYVVLVRGHILCIVDGTVHDWSEGKALRALTVWRVIRPGEQEQQQQMAARCAPRRAE